MLVVLMLVPIIDLVITMKIYICAFILALSSTLASAQSYTLMTIKQREETNVENFFVDLSKEIFKRAGLRLRVQPHYWLKAQKTVMRAKPELGYLIVPLTRTAEREHDFDWLLPIEKYQLQLISNDTKVNVLDTNSLKALPVCALRESPAQYKLQELGFTNIKAEIREKKCYEHLMTGKVKVVMSYGELSAKARFANVGGSAADLKFGLAFREETLYLASSKQVMAAGDLEKIKNALEEMKADGTYAQFRNKY